MMVSMAIAVLPVWRSPMISSRWPRPIGIMASMAFRPVWSGSFTGWRWTTPGALNSAGQALADGDLQQAVGALDRVPLDDVLPGAEQHGADVVGLEVEREAGDVMGQLEHLERLAVLEAVDAGDAVGHGEDGAHLREVGLPLVEPLDAALEDGGDLVWLDLHLCPCHLFAELFQTRANRRVDDGVAHPDDDAAEDVGLDLGGQLDLLAGLLADPVADVLDGRFVELDRGG